MPSSTLLTWERAMSTIATTPSVFATSSTVGAARAAPQPAASCGEPSLATRFCRATPPGIDTVVATSPPHAKASTSSFVGSGSKKSSSETNSQNGTARSAKSRTEAAVAFGYEVKNCPAS
jgi:hypothetical protein